MEQTDFTLQGARCVVIGCGRIGALLARKLHALDALVTVSARSARDFARIEAAGLAALDTRRLAGHLDGFDLVFKMCIRDSLLTRRARCATAAAPQR